MSDDQFNETGCFIFFMLGVVGPAIFGAMYLGAHLLGWT